MATKRMFSKNIVGSDAFMDMSIGSQLLYFHLGMESDDDGFIGNPKKIMRGIGCKDGDMQELIMKRFVLLFDSGVLVMKHHRINNNWDSYNCKRTIYVEELSQLSIKENKGYTLDKSQGLSVQSEVSLKTDLNQSLEENRIDKNRKEENTNTIQFFLFNKNTQTSKRIIIEKILSCPLNINTVSIYFRKLISKYLLHALPDFFLYQFLPGQHNKITHRAPFL